MGKVTNCSNCLYSKIRYECEECPIYLCRDCYDNNVSINNHSPNHSMAYLDNCSDSDESEDKNDEDELEDYDDDNNNYDEDEDGWENNNRQVATEEDDDDEDYYDEDEEDISENYAEFFEELDNTVSRIFQRLNTSTSGNGVQNGGTDSSSSSGIGSHAESCKVYSCPYCSLGNLSEPYLIEHILSNHSKDKTQVVCPICSARPGGDPNYYSKHLPSHLTLRHSSSVVLDSSNSVNNRLARLSVSDLNLLKNTDLLSTLFSNTSLSSVLGSLGSTSSSNGGSSATSIKHLSKKPNSTAINKFLNDSNNSQDNLNNIYNFLDSNCTNKMNLNTSQNNINIRQSSSNTTIVNPNINTNDKSTIIHSNITSNNINNDNSDNNINEGNTILDDNKIKKPVLTILNQSTKPHSVEDIERKNNEIILKSTFARELLYDSIFS